MTVNGFLNKSCTQHSFVLLPTLPNTGGTILTYANRVTTTQLYRGNKWADRLGAGDVGSRCLLNGQRHISGAALHVQWLFSYLGKSC